VKAHLERAPSFFVQPVEPVEPMPRVPRERTSDVRCALIVPDIQAGFRRIEDNKSPGGYRWVPLHDRKAMNAVLQIAEAYSHQIDTVVHLGDHLDLAPWSTRWTSDSSLKYTSNAALRELYAGFLVPLREILPHAHMVYMEGNHEKRIEDALASKLGEASTLRTADTLDGHSLLSIPSLLALDSIDVEYIAPYGKVWWLYDQIRISHGSVARRGGGNTAAEYLKRATSSAIWGHTHRLEMAQKRLTTPKGIEIITAASPGCLCRSEIGVVPGVLGNPPDWQQGVGLVYENNGKHSMHMIPIVDGVAIFNGEVFEGEDIPEEWAERTGLPF
jgi:predicted phosphodiesterase